MKVLIIYPTLTHPVNAGNKQWVMAQVEELRNLGHDVYMLCVNIPGLKESIVVNKEEIRKTKEYWGDHIFIYNASKWLRFITSATISYRKKFHRGYFKCDDLYPNGLTKFTNKLHSKFQFDACIVNYYWLTKVLDDIDIKIKVVNTHDVFAYRDLVVDMPKSWMCTTPNEEAKGIQRADYALALQDEESVYLSRIAPKTKVLNVYCPYKLEEQPPVFNHNLVFLSSAGSVNIEGFEWFVKNIYSTLIKKIPDIKIVVAGNICNYLSEYKNNPHFELIGRVEDPADLYKYGDVAINPCVHGTGLKIKTFEALSYGKICMTHPHSIIGIYKKDTAPLFSSESASDWAAYLNEIWSNPTILKNKMKDSINYINEMNEHINKEYKKIFE